jgi:hypothetical protein
MCLSYLVIHYKVDLVNLAKHEITRKAAQGDVCTGYGR